MPFGFTRCCGAPTDTDGNCTDCGNVQVECLGGCERYVTGKGDVCEYCSELAAKIPGWESDPAQMGDDYIRVHRLYSSGIVSADEYPNCSEYADAHLLASFKSFVSKLKKINAKEANAGS